MTECPRCKFDKNIGNPSGFCDHYPDYCGFCRATFNENRRVLDNVERFFDFHIKSLQSHKKHSSGKMMQKQAKALEQIFLTAKQKLNSLRLIEKGDDEK